MTIKKLTTLLVIATLLSGCGWDLTAPDDDNGDSDPGEETIFRNATSDNLPNSLEGESIHIKAADINGDESPDIIIAISLERNKVLRNNGNGTFTDDSTTQVPGNQRLNSRSVVIADFNTDTYPDLFFLNSSNQTNELYLNSSTATFSDLSNRIPITGNFTVAKSIDLEENQIPDLIIGSNGQNRVLINNGNAFFADQSNQRLPQILDNTSDLALGDLTGDGAKDIVVANQGDNAILINNGSDSFADESGDRLPDTDNLEETQNVLVADIDGDDDLDIYLGNSAFENNGNSQGRLLINDGDGFFEDETSNRLPEIFGNTFDAEFSDLDQDGDADLVIGNYEGGIQILINNGDGNFEDKTEEWIPEDFEPAVNDLEITDFNGDGFPDIYIAVHDGDDQILIQREP